MLREEPDYPPAMGRIAAAYFVDGQEEEGIKYAEMLRKKGYDCSSILEEQARAFTTQNRIAQASLLRAAASQINKPSINTPG
jgi:hypothetical protein